MRQFQLFQNSAEEDVQAEEQSKGSKRDLKSSGIQELAFSLETTGRNPFSDTIIGIALCKERGKAYYVPVAHKEGNNFPQALSLLKGTFEDAAVAKIAHDLKYHMLMLRQQDICLQGTFYDVMVAAYLLNPNKSSHTLEDIALDYLLFKKKSLSDIVSKKTTFADVPLDQATAYAAENAELAFELKKILFGRLKEEELDTLYFEIEMPLISVLADMEEVGVAVDREKIAELSKELERELDVAQATIYRLAGEEFNINSPRQLSKVLFEKLGLKPGKKTKTGYSTGIDTLEELAKAHELPQEIINYRMLSKLKTTYIDVLPKLIDERTGRIHTSFNQTVTATGRLSSSDPNLQNIPVRGEWGKRIRETFVAESGGLLLSADYSQVELRILAHLSNDQGLIEAFRNGIDVHTKTASELFNISPDEVNAEMRRVAKVVNFGVIYGMSPYGLSEELDIPPKKAALYIDHYFEVHQGVKDYFAQVLESTRQTGYAKTLFGRKRAIPDIANQNAVVRQQAERFAMNTPIQGTAADIIKIAMINISRRFSQGKVRAKMVLQIHDELLFEVPEGEIEKVTQIVQYEMEHAIPLSVPLKVEIGSGKNWAQAH